MTFQIALDATKFLIKNAEEEGVTPHLNFFGGEPTLMWDDIIVPLTNWIRQEYKKPFSLGITTNGTLLNDERISFLKNNKISLLFSIDGDKQTQDYNRPYHNGEGSFDDLNEIIPKIIKDFPYTTFRSTVIPETCEHTFDNIMFAKEKGFKNFYTVPNVFENWDENKKEILKKEIDKYIEYYINEFRNGNTPIELTTLKDVFNDIKKINYAIKKGQNRSLRQCFACGKCGLGGNKSASIHPNGNIYSCQEMTSNEGEKSIFYIGNIYSDINDNLRIRLMNIFDSKKATGFDCDNCKYNRICNGGCVANNYMITGDMNINPPMYCWWQQLILDGAIRIMQTLGEEENEAFYKKWSKKR